MSIAICLMKCSGKRRTIVALRQPGGRTLTRVVLRAAESADCARTRVEPGTIVSADEAARWDLSAPDFETRCINHSEVHSQDGIHTSRVESFV